MIYGETSGTFPDDFFGSNSGSGVAFPPGTSGSNPDIFDQDPPRRHASWGLSWGFAWGNSWGFIRYISPAPVGGGEIQIIRTEGSGEGSAPYPGTTFSSGEIFDENSGTGNPPFNET